MLRIPQGFRAIETNPYRIYYKAVNRKRDQLTDAATKDVAAFLNDERQRVVKAVSGAVSPEAALNLAFHQVTGYEAFLTDLSMTVAQSFAEDVLEGVRKDSLMSMLLRQYISSYIGFKVVGITDTRRTELQELILQGIQEGLSIPKIAKSLDALYLDEIIPKRSRVIARTEVIAASNAGSYISAKSTGLPLKKVWLSTADNRTREIHASADGQVVGIDDAFIVAGERLLFPGDSSLGATAANLVACRCAIIYQVE